MISEIFLIKKHPEINEKGVAKSSDCKKTKTLISDDPCDVFDGFLESKLMRIRSEINENLDEEEISKKMIFRSEI